MDEQKKPGRPLAAKKTESVPVCVRLPPAVYDDVFQRAKRLNMSVPEYLRKDLRDPKKPAK